MSNPPFVVGPGSDPLHVPRLGPGRRRRSAPSSPRPRPTCSPRAARCSTWPTGCTCAARTGTTGWPAGSPAPAATPGSSSARCPTRSTYVNLWLRDASEASRPGAGPRPGWTGSTRTRWRASASAWSPLRRSGHADPVVRVEELRQPSSRRWVRTIARLVRPPGLARARRTPRLLATGVPAGARAGRCTQEASHRRRGLGRVDRQVLTLTDGPALGRGGRPGRAGPGLGCGRHGRAARPARRAGRAPSTRRRPCWPRWPRPSSRTWSSAASCARLIAVGASPGAGRTVGVRAVVQTVSRASVTVDDEVVGAIADGLLVLLGVTHTDTPASPTRWPARCTSCASSTTRSRPRRSARRCWWSASSPSTATPARAAGRAGPRPPGRGRRAAGRRRSSRRCAAGAPRSRPAGSGPTCWSRA